MSRIRWYGPTVALFFTLALVMVAGPPVARQLAWAQTQGQSDGLREQLSNNETLAELSDSFRKVAQAVEPSVVHIRVLSRQQDRRRGNLPDDLLERFFGPQFKERFRDQQQPRQPQRPDGGQDMEPYNVPRERGNGSGWVYDQQGHIITNHHVVAQADEIKVRFHDGSERDAKVVGNDPQTDVAVLKVDHDNLHPAQVAEAPISQGEIVFAFGSPFQFEFSMSQGIVSAKGRNLGIIRSYDEQSGRVRAGYENFIQTDAAVNPGNSGGPLTNIYGQVVGMNTAIASRTGSYNGIGFAIPAQMVRDVVNQIIDTGEVSRGYLGVYIDDLDEQMARSFNYDNAEGVLVVEPIEGSPGAAAGLQAGDIITEVNGNAVTAADELRYMIASMKPGSEVELQIFRNGEPQTVTVKLGRLGEDSTASAEPGGGGDEATPGPGDNEAAALLRKFGIGRIETFTEQAAGRMGIQHKPGVLIGAVRPNSLAASKNLEEGMLITHVMGQRAESAEQLLGALKGRDPQQPTRFRVQQWNPRQEEFGTRFVVLALPEMEE